MKKSFSLLLTISFGAVLFFGCARKSEDGDMDVKPRAVVKVAVAHLGSIDRFVSSTGTFEVLRDERIKSTIAGKVQKVFVLEGDSVRKGQVIVTIVSQESYAAIEGAAQLVNEAATNAEKTQAEEALHLAETTAAIAKISAPFSGSTVHRFVTEGELVSQGSDLVEIIDPSTEYFAANIPIDEVSSIRIGELAVVTISGMTSLPMRGTIQAITPATDLNSQSVEVRIILRSIPSKVASGTFGNVRIETGVEKSVVLIPRQAVYHDDELDRYFVWRIQGDSLALMTQVHVGLEDSSDFEITSGIKQGDFVATVGGYGLPDSTDVKVE